MIEAPQNWQEFEELLDSVNLTNQLLEFFATWCNPCQMMGPKFHKLADEFDGAVIFAHVDVDLHEDLATRYDVEVMPTFVFIRNREKIHTIEGSNFEELRKMVDIGSTAYDQHF
ncbi:thioredoxin domain-containing protein [Ditylenchus destructor]|nr:thioredoxin domain-containing protein [Ditylenchus destructor]